MSRDIPIIFSAPMILALLAGRKTMTRRLADRPCGGGCKGRCKGTGRIVSPWQNVKPGDRLWVRESVQAVVDEDFDAVNYLADGNVRRSTADTQAEADRYQDQLFCYRGRKNAPNTVTGVAVPSIHMPRWVSRLTLIVSAIKVERLLDISEADAEAEGVERVPYDGADPKFAGQFGFKDYRKHPHAAVPFRKASKSFETLWESLHSAGSWQANPEVVALSFLVVRANIDAPEARAA